MQTPLSSFSLGRRRTSSDTEPISRIVRAPFPVIAAVNGTAAGGGMGLACSCDMIIAGESTKFIMAYTRRGLTPDGTTTYFLPRRIGVGRAIELAYTNRTLSAREALEWGLVNRVVPRARLLDETLALATLLASKPPLTLASALGAIHRGMDAAIDDGLAIEEAAFAAIVRTHDAHEGVQAFIEKRPPRFLGR